MYKRLFNAILPLLFSACLLWLSSYQVRNYNDSLSFRYKSYGNVTKETIVIIPGLDGVTAFFSEIVPELTPEYHIVVYNLPLCKRGCNQSTYTFEYIASDLNSVLNELELDHVSMIGESFGGIVAQHFAHNYPNKLDKLILLSSLAKAILPPDIQWKLNKLMPIIGGFGYYYPYFAQMLFAQIHVDDVVEPTESKDTKDLFIKEASFAHFYSVLARIRIASTLDILDIVPKISTPTMVIYGEDDHFTKKDSLQIHSLLPNSVLASLPGGHLAHVGSPKQFSSLIAGFVGRIAEQATTISEDKNMIDSN